MDTTVTGVSNSKAGGKGYKENRILVIKTETKPEPLKLKTTLSKEKQVKHQVIN